MFNIADNRIYMNDENGKMIAEVTFPNLDDNTIVIDHTFVDDSIRGQGIAAKLMLEVIDYAKSNNKKIKATCSYAVKWFSFLSYYLLDLPITYLYNRIIN